MWCAIIMTAIRRWVALAKNSHGKQLYLCKQRHLNNAQLVFISTVCAKKIIMHHHQHPKVQTKGRMEVHEKNVMHTKNFK